MGLTGRGTAGFVLGFAASVATTMTIGAFSDPDLRPLLFAVTVLVLAFCLEALISHLRWLNVMREVESERSGSAREAVIDDVVRSLTSYGVLRTDRDLNAMRRLSAGFSYRRGQNFYGLLLDGFREASGSIRVVNDHPFSPFSEAARAGLSSGASIQIINSVPDDLYQETLIEERIKLARDERVAYYLMPAEDIHLSLIIFDDSSALIYATPPGRAACAYSEALYTDDGDLIKLLNKAYDHVSELAAGALRERGTDALTVLERARKLAASGAHISQGEDG